MKLSVVVVLGIAAIGALGVGLGKPAYEQYQVKKELARPVAAGYAAITPIDRFIEEQGNFPLLDDLKGLGLLKRQPGVAFIMPESDGISAQGELQIQLPNDGVHPALLNQKVIFVRDDQGRWTCTTTLDEHYRPDNCQSDAPPQPVYLG